MFHCPHAGNLTAFGIGYSPSPGNQAHLSLIACNLRWANCSYFWFRARGLAADLAQWAARPEAWLINDHLEGGAPKWTWRRTSEKLQKALNHECRRLLMAALPPHLLTRQLLSDGINPHIFQTPSGRLNRWFHFAQWPKINRTRH